MKGEDVLKIAEDNSKMFIADYSDPSGAAFIGNLSMKMQNEMVAGLAQAVGGTMVQEYPVNILKSKDAKSVRVALTAYIFSPEQLIDFTKRLFDAANNEQRLALVPPRGEG